MIKRFGFTLAEVLITIGIIGVVAAISMPTLISNSQKAEETAAFMKAYSMMNQAFGMIAADNSDFQSALSPYGEGDTMAFVELFSKKMKVARYCNDPDVANDCFSYSYTTINRGAAVTKEHANPMSLVNNAYITQDGISYQFTIVNPNCIDSYLDGKNETNGGDPTSGLWFSCGIAAVDVNGPKVGPARYGRDLFFFVVSKNGVYPFGKGMTKAKMDEDCNTESSPNGGVACGLKILTDGSMDY